MVPGCGPVYPSLRLNVDRLRELLLSGLSPAEEWADEQSGQVPGQMSNDWHQGWQGLLHLGSVIKRGDQTQFIW